MNDAFELRYTIFFFKKCQFYRISSDFFADLTGIYPMDILSTRKEKKKKKLLSNTCKTPSSQRSRGSFVNKCGKYNTPLTFFFAKIAKNMLAMLEDTR